MDARAADQPPYPEASPPCSRSALHLRLRRPLARRAVLAPEVKCVLSNVKCVRDNSLSLNKEGRRTMPNTSSSVARCGTACCFLCPGTPPRA